MSRNYNWQKELSTVILTLVASSLVFLPIAIVVVVLLSWLLKLFNLYPWLAEQPRVYFWSVFAVICLLGMGSVMVWMDKFVDNLAVLKNGRDSLVLSVSVMILTLVSVLYYFSIAWFINFLNVTFWLT